MPHANSGSVRPVDVGDPIFKPHSAPAGPPGFIAVTLQTSATGASRRVASFANLPTCGPRSSR